MSWPTARLDECTRIVSGATPATTVPENWDGDIRWVTPRDLSDLDGVFISDTPRRITRQGLTSCSAEVLPENSVLFSSRAPIGHVAINSKPMATNQGFKSFIPNGKRLRSDYLYWWLKANRTYLESLGNGATFKEVSKAVVARIEIPLPPLDEQRRIAAILDQANRLRRSFGVRAVLLSDLQKSLFREMFGAPNDFRWDWPTLSFGEAGRVQLGRQRAPKYQSGKHTKPYLRVANVYEDRLSLGNVLSMDFDARDFREYKLEYGDILLNEGQSTELVGRPAMWKNEISDCCFQNTLIRFQPNAEIVDPLFALYVCLYYFRTGSFSKISSKTSSVAHLGAGRLAALPFPIPPIELQRRFVKVAEEVNRAKATNELSVQDAGNLFASLQHRAFSGQLTAKLAERELAEAG